MSQKSKVADTFVHYYKTAFLAAGVPWSEDNEREIRTAIDDLLTLAEECASDQTSRIIDDMQRTGEL